MIVHNKLLRQKKARHDNRAFLAEPVKTILLQLFDR
jgi:hypothetical protein